MNNFNELLFIDRFELFIIFPFDFCYKIHVITAIKIILFYYYKELV